MRWLSAESRPMYAIGSKKNHGYRRPATVQRLKIPFAYSKKMPLITINQRACFSQKRDHVDAHIIATNYAYGSRHPTAYALS